VATVSTGGTRDAQAPQSVPEALCQMSYYGSHRTGFETLRMDGSDGLSIPGWEHYYAPGGYTDGVRVRTRPAYVESVIVERPVLITDSGSFGFLIFNVKDPLISAGPPGSAGTTATYGLPGATTQGSYVVPVQSAFDRGLFIRFENFGVATGRITVVYHSFGRFDPVHSR
jgi:hypothetical protein